MPPPTIPPDELPEPQAGGAKRPSLIGMTVKSVLVVAALFWFAGGWISSATDRQALAQLTGRISRGEHDPMTTGSLGRTANATKLDPCTVQPRR